MTEEQLSIERINVSEVRLHESPDLDAKAEYWLISRFGDKHFVNFNEADITFWPQQSMPESPEELLTRGKVCLDVGGGPLDHHPHGKCLTKCGTDLAAEYLGIQEDIALQPILEYVRLQDLEGPTSTSRALRDEGTPSELVEKVSLIESFSFASVISHQPSSRPKQWKDSLKWVCQQLDSFYEQQRYFWTTVKDEYNQKAAVSTFQIFDATEEDPDRSWKTLKIAVIESSIKEVGSFSRTKEGGYIHICVNRDPETGHTFISGQLKSHQFIEVAKILRVLEMKQRGYNEKYDLSDLEKSWMEACPIWYLPMNLHGEVFIIMNGGKKAQEVEPSTLSLDTILKTIIIALNDKVLAIDCPKSECRKNKCGFYPFGLARCQRIRTR